MQFHIHLEGEKLSALLIVVDVVKSHSARALLHSSIGYGGLAIVGVKNLASDRWWLLVQEEPFLPWSCGAFARYEPCWSPSTLASVCSGKLGTQQ